MGQFIKVFTGIFFLLLLFYTGISIGYMQLKAEEARVFKSKVITEMENSDYSLPVIQDLFKQAKEKEYQLYIEFYRDEESMVQVNNIPGEEIGDVVFANITLTYPYGMSLFGSERKKSMEGIAR